jgi:hypothetical protein
MGIGRFRSFGRVLAYSSATVSTCCYMASPNAVIWNQGLDPGIKHAQNGQGRHNSGSSSYLTGSGVLYPNMLGILGPYEMRSRALIWGEKLRMIPHPRRQDGERSKIWFISAKTWGFYRPMSDRTEAHTRGKDDTQWGSLTVSCECRKEPTSRSGSFGISEIGGWAIFAQLRKM